MNSKTATFSVIAAGTLWGITSVFVNRLSEYALSSMEIGFLRMLICAAVMLAAILIYKPSLLKIHIKDIWMFIGSGIVSLTFFSWCYFTTIINAEASIAVSLLYTSPVWVMLFSAVLFKERLNLQKIIAILATVLGCVLIAGISKSGMALNPKILVIGIGAGVGYALYSIFGRYALEKYDSITITFYTFLFAAIGFVFLIHPAKLAKQCIQSPEILGIGFLLSLICGVLPYMLYTIGLKHLETSTAAILAAVEPLVGCIVGFVIFKDEIIATKILGIILILASILILNIKINKKQNKSRS